MSWLDVQQYHDKSGTGMRFELVPIWGLRGDVPDILGAIFMIDGVEHERFVLDGDGFHDQLGNIFTPKDWAEYLSNAVNEIRSKRREGKRQYLGGEVKRTGIFLTQEDLSALRTAQSCSGMYLSGGLPMSDPAWEAEQLRKKYNQPEGYGIDTSNGEFISPK